MYARLFCAAALATGFAWAGLAVVRRWGATPNLALPATLPVMVLAYQLARYDPPAAVAGIVVSGAVLLTSRWWARGRAGAAAWRAVLSNERVFLGLLFVGALALRLLFTLRVMSNPNYIETGADGVFYDQIAWSIAQGHGIVNPDFPLYILGYPRFYRVAGHSYLALCAVQSLLGAVVPVAIYYLARATFGRAVAAVTAVLTAVSFPLVFAAAAMGHQALDVAVTAVLVGALAAAVWRPFETWWQWAGIGALFGAAVAVRETNAAFLAFVFGWLWYAVPRSASRMKPRTAAVWLTAGVLLALTPMVARMVGSPEARLALSVHFDRIVSGDMDQLPIRAGMARPLTDPEGARQQLLRDPMFVLRTQARVARHFLAVQFFAQPYGEFDLLTLRKGSAYQFGMLAYAYLFVTIGAAIGWRRVREGGRWAPVIALMIGLLVFRTLPHLLIYSSYGHRVPIEPFLILFCQAGFWGVVWKAQEPA